MSRKRPRVLLIAEAANPEWVSVPLVGWSHARALFDHVDAHLVTSPRNREAIERQGWRQGEQFTCIDSEAVAAPVWKFTSWLRKRTGLGWTAETAVNTLSYYYFEQLLWKRFGPAITAREYDIVHRLTPLSPTTPSLIAGKCHAAGVPFVLGPLNGGVPWPPGFLDVVRSEGEWLSYVRDAYKLMPGYSGTRRHAAAIVTGSRSTHQQMSGHHDRCVYLPENAIDPARFPPRPRTPAGPASASDPLRVAFVGRLVPYKGADMLIEGAAPLLRSGLVSIDIIGDGPQMPELKALVEREGVGQAVTFAGWVAHTAVGDRLGQAEVFGFPSIREFGGGVVLEAMALGLVPVVVDYAGPAELVTDSTGFRVPVGKRPEIVARMREVLTRLCAERASLAPMAERARQRVFTLFSWDAKARQMLEIYDWVRGLRDKPDFGMPLPDVPNPAATAAPAAPQAFRNGSI